MPARRIRREADGIMLTRTVRPINHQNPIDRPTSVEIS
jgi:hypothetical protein